MTPEQTTAGARTVAHLATYFEELKQAARELIEAARASGRGYFTPGEEEAVRRLQVSYWQSRAALFEVIGSFRQDSELKEELRPDAFLVAFGAAVLLVDAARFLREAFEPLPLVRQKLNEPAPHFGIPEGTYATVQKSLTSPLHVWHLYHAVQYFDEHAAELRARATDPLLAAVLAVIERLKSRLDVPVRRYLKARLQVRADEAISRLRYGLLGRALYGMQKLVASLAADIYTRPGHHPHLPRAVAQRLGELLEPGDVLIARKEHAATNYFLPGYWKHAALYLGTPAALERLGIADHENVRPRWSRLLSAGEPVPRRVLEAMKDGVWIRSVSSPFSADAVVAIRPRLSTDDVAAALARGLFHEGKPYDFDFDFTRADRLVCTEVVYRSYDGVGGVSFELTHRAGRLTLSAEDLVRMSLEHTHFEPLAVFAPEHASKLATGKEADVTLQETREAT
ncbi:MAG: YiiX/YebB-like N1pC/P60 family cysteine hydrolase [Planctomycetota bacterium]|jgi:hypothetical protein